MKIRKQWEVGNKKKASSSLTVTLSHGHTDMLSHRHRHFIARSLQLEVNHLQVCERCSFLVHPPPLLILPWSVRGGVRVVLSGVVAMWLADSP